MNRNDYLMHYGIKGMKWGVRHDPERVGSASNNGRRGLSDRQKTALKVAAGTALVVGGTVALARINKANWKRGDAVIKKLADKQAARHVKEWGKHSISDTKVVNSAKNYSRFVKKSRGVLPSGTKIRSTSGHLTGHSQVIDRRGAAQHRARFYDRAKVTYQNRFNASLNGKKPTDMQKIGYEFNNNILESNRINALDQLKYTKSRGVSNSVPRRLHRP